MIQADFCLRDELTRSIDGHRQALLKATLISVTSSDTKVAALISVACSTDTGEGQHCEDTGPICESFMAHGKVCFQPCFEEAPLS